MTKPRDILKGKVKRLLREQEDMGQLCDPAVDNFVSALEAFVHDIGRRLQSEAESSGASMITPIELKRCVVSSPDLAFLHDKVQAIDESDAKYHKQQGARKRKATPPATSADSKAKKPQAKRKANAAETGSPNGKPRTQAKAPKATAVSSAAAKSIAEETAPAPVPASLEIEEDDNYDSSDSD